MQTLKAIARLNQLLPLKSRQAKLPANLKRLHQQILINLAVHGVPPADSVMTEILGDEDLSLSLRQLGKLDLIVLNDNKNTVLGAYPLTSEVTPHRLQIGQHAIYAMCALDAVAVAPMFATEVKITSRCHVSAEPVSIHMQGESVKACEPSTVMIGVRWQMPTNVAAHSMCLQMIFLKDKKTAKRWQGEEEDVMSLFSLPEAIAFAAGFFLPLLQT